MYYFYTSSFCHLLVAGGVIVAVELHQPVAAALGALGGGRVVFPDHGSSWLFDFWRQFW